MLKNQTNTDIGINKEIKEFEEQLLRIRINNCPVKQSELDKLIAFKHRQNQEAKKAPGHEKRINHEYVFQGIKTIIF